jgi:signal transduction histidine kinase
MFLVIDLNLDSWVSGEFDRSNLNKLGLLTTLINEDENGVEFNFSDEHMPEFSRKKNPEYFQLWLGNKVFERSETLVAPNNYNLPRDSIKLNELKIVNITLPNNQSGRLYLTKFTPQIDSNIRNKIAASPDNTRFKQEHMELAYAISDDELNRLVWLIDALFILCALISVAAIRVIVSKVVSRELLPLDKLNEDLKNIDLESKDNPLETKSIPVELMPIINGINHFLKENKNLYEREKRITSNIAHELETPITELINLSEVAIKFPNEKRITDSFNTDVFTISERLKNIVNNILELHKNTKNTLIEKNKINIKNKLLTIIHRDNTESATFNLNIEDSETLYSNESVIDIIFCNLISNAIHYSEDNNDINIEFYNDKSRGEAIFSITNTSKYEYSDSEIENFFEPLWQKDLSRTSSDRFGLGLAIVKSYCESINATITADLHSINKVTLTLIIKLDPSL